MPLAPVQPTPVPPKRDLVVLPPLPKVALHTEGRFTVLSYNILADLYATVGLCPQYRSAAVTSVLWSWSDRRWICGGNVVWTAQVQPSMLCCSGSHAEIAISNT